MQSGITPGLFVISLNAQGLVSTPRSNRSSGIRWVHNTDHVAIVARLVCERSLALRSAVFGTGEISATMLMSFALYHLATDAVISCNLRKESLKHVGYC